LFSRAKANAPAVKGRIIMRQKTKLAFIINWLSMMSCVLLSLLFASPSLAASIYHDVTIVDIQPVRESPYTHQLRLLVGSRAETLMLHRSDAFDATRVVSIDSDGAHPDSLGGFSIYQGKLKNVEDSWARIVLQGNEVSGIIDTGDERIHLNHPVTRDRIRQIHAGLQAPFSQPLAAPLEALDDESSYHDVSGEVVEIDIGNSFFNQPEKVTKVASIAIVIDSAYDEAIGGRGLAQAISTINAVDGIYREEFGLALKVETAIMITDNETLALGDVSLEDNLTRFRDYRLIAEQISNDLALVHLFTGVLTADASVGLAYIDTVCRTNGYDVSLSLPFRYPILLTAHEIGHNLGALHDDETSQCNTLSDRLMFSRINEHSTRAFSACSVDAISKRLEESTCHADAIDMSVTLARQDQTGVIALITNTDTLRAFPAATLTLEMQNASIAAAPASCIVATSNSLSCDVETTFAEESQSLAFDLRLDEEEEIIITATLDAVGFVDVHSSNNTAEIIVPQVIVTQNDPNQPDDETLTDSGDGEDPQGGEGPGTADANDGSTNGGNASSASGGGTLSAIDAVLVLGLLLLAGRTRRLSEAASH
jgi:hypothetical protein